MATIKERPPTVRLVEGSPERAVDLFYEVWKTTRGYPTALPGTDVRRQHGVEIFRKLIFDFTPIPEMIKFTFYLDGIPRAMYDQLTRHRQPCFFAVSHRIHPVDGFSERGDYLTTQRVAENPKWRERYDATMEAIDDAYSWLISQGCPIEDARGIMPLHQLTSLYWSVTLRDLVHVFRTRTCHLLQQQYWAPITAGVRSVLVEKEPELGIIFEPPCVKANACISPTEASMKSDWTIAGDRQDAHPCRLFIEKFEEPRRAQKVRDAVNNGVTRWAESPEEAL